MQHLHQIHSSMTKMIKLRQKLRRQMQSVPSAPCGLPRVICSCPTRTHGVSGMQTNARKPVQRRLQRNPARTQGVHQKPLARLQPQPSNKYEGMGRLRLATPLRGPMLQLLTATPRRAASLRRLLGASTPLKDIPHLIWSIHHGTTDTPQLNRALIQTILIR